jgi:hypothetical protein
MTLVRHTGIAAAIATTLALLAAGCGGDDAADRTVTVTSQGQSPSAPTTGAAEMTVAQAGRAYLALVAPLNERIAGINDQIERAEAADDPAAVAQALEDYADVADDFQDGVLKIDFPAEARQQADDLVGVVAGSAADARLAARSVDSPGALQAALAEWAGSLGELSGRAASLRDALGLPPATQP